MSWSVDVYFDILVKHTRPEVVKLAKIAKNSGFSRLELVRAITFERKVVVKLPKIAVFIENIFKIYKKPYPFKFGGGWGLFVFHKYFLVKYSKNVILAIFEVSDFV